MLENVKMHLGVTRMDRMRNEFIRGTAGPFGGKVREVNTVLIWTCTEERLVDGCR